jgi:hypothetical protein
LPPTTTAAPSTTTVTTTFTATPTESSNGVSPGAVGGIAGGIVGGFLILGALAFVYINRHPKQATTGAPIEDNQYAQEQGTRGDKTRTINSDTMQESDYDNTSGYGGYGRSP